MRRVIKVGGSLLAQAGLTESLPLWMNQQGAAENVIVVGGGAVVDAIRQWDAIRPVDPAWTHWLCVDLLDITFQLMSQWFPWATIADSSELQRAIEEGFSPDRPTIVAVRSFYNRTSGVDVSALPQNWQTTTDSIAALLASRIGADELVILKSCDVDPETTMDQLAADGIVDEAFPRISSTLARVRVERLNRPTNHD